MSSFNPQILLRLWPTSFFEEYCFLSIDETSFYRSIKGLPGSPRSACTISTKGSLLCACCMSILFSKLKTLFVSAKSSYTDVSSWFERESCFGWSGILFACSNSSLYSRKLKSSTMSIFSSNCFSANLVWGSRVYSSSSESSAVYSTFSWWDRIIYLSILPVRTLESRIVNFIRCISLLALSILSISLFSLSCSV